MNKKTILIVITIVVLSYIVTSAGFWLVENTFSIAGRVFLYESHRKLIEGKGPAPNQYRYAPYLLVEYFFKYIPLRWYCNTYIKLERWLGFDKRAFVQKENELNLNAHISAEEREKIIEDLESFIKDKLLEITKNPLTTNLIVNVVNNFGWKEWIEDPFTFLQQFSQQMPDNIKDIFDKKSDLTKIINGYANMRFTFTIIILLFLYLWMRIFTNEFVSYVSLFAYSIFIVFSYGDFGQQEFLISVALFIAGITLIYRKKPWWMILVLISLECFVRTDHALFIAVIYSLYNLPLNRKKLSLHGILFFIPIFATYLLAKVFFPNAVYYTLPFILEENLQDPWAIVYPTVFFVLPLLFIKKFGEYEFYKKTWLWMIPFVALNLMMGAVREIRLFLPLMAYLFPVLFTGIVSLYNTNEN
ncbi:hypothetical protein [Thermotoga profunda]|uniref:hypothetical protein n=1 Tax=Thermotoga profunda TaxID=1508420 RepID=UPI000596CC80|nr:hypothetical protein [Thermotoga profunda]